ncbi:hypothetical protein COY52_07145 [Candidatus Desantisbacteria bacterium CG_4_10_14_0_8_um_filter_48_22]|uniref:CN hydrolase domain-containing protein n=1 Tax=Candidatus Desantisbacteria bacterium CG_4_10_14_0_8_um_filter_48_22 TaxID=1974543 RepID=A0A2M7SA55_9BACT|nr:MAG: hypothetical protein AUJ67_03625 [Candidatus Desantisbacteria bacterium CG1_02_49_89]PIV54466.1 MAG: hypothetical protein COS16_10265 [Candidatus Desantisbacteria bacterium CG02_land_8_20_14_3_00_49_13]PIZ16412.1 MAG: hypothetical protein COY52_07145 [Candidatus Desantisbacteria bacterium CG_4_10_14_0_8_um_filter_48_22]
MRLRVAGAQIPVTGEIGMNLKAIRRAIKYAKSRRADILLTPEGSLSGYTHKFNPDEVRNALREITTGAREKRLGLALGTCFVEDNGKCYNQIRFYSPKGGYLGFHSKILRCGSVFGKPEGEIRHYAARPLRTFRFKNIIITNRGQTLNKGIILLTSPVHSDTELKQPSLLLFSIVVPYTARHNLTFLLKYGIIKIRNCEE